MCFHASGKFAPTSSNAPTLSPYWTTLHDT
jgi:hypothetical protein